MAIALLCYIATLLAARHAIRAAAALGASPQWIHVLEDGALAAVLVAGVAAAIGGFTQRWEGRVHRRVIAIATAWAIVNVAVLERARARAIAEALLLLVVWCAIALRRSPPSPQRHGGCLVLASAMLALLPTTVIERPIATKHLRGLVVRSGDVAGMDRLRRWMRTARESVVRVDTAELASAGEALLLSDNEMAWNTAIDMVDYRWALEDYRWKPAAGSDAHLPVWGTLQVDLVPIGRAGGAMLARIGESGTSSLVAAMLIVTRARGPGAVVLDGLRMRNVVFDRVPVAYNGGPLDLENVSFPNCSFYAARTEAGRRFLKAALAAGPMRFRQLTP